MQCIMECVEDQLSALESDGVSVCMRKVESSTKKRRKCVKYGGKEVVRGV